MKVLMVCLGNICRSPMAEGILKHKVKEQGLDWLVESCGTNGYHIGDSADSRAISVCTEMGINIKSHRARRFKKSDFESFDIIYALASDVYEDIQYVSNSPEQMKKVKLILDELHPGRGRSVNDPYYGGRNDFVDVYHQLIQVCDAIITNYR